MTPARDPSLCDLDTCGCDQRRLVTPALVGNRPGLAAVAYRSGTHAGFRQTMLARLSAADHQALAGLRTRDGADFTIALLDAWAAVCDVLTFYTERAANESWPRTATEPVAVQQQARLIGYRRGPGVAAGVWLAFEIEDTPGGPAEVAIPTGSRVQSLPPPGELPQTFETSADLLARPEYNALRPRLTRPQPLSTGLRRLVLRGVATSVSPGDRVLLVAGTAATDRAVRPVLSVTADTAAGTTELALDLAAPPPPPAFELPSLPAAEYETHAQMSTTLTGSFLHHSVLGVSWDAATFRTLAAVQRWPLGQVSRGLARQRELAPRPVTTGAFAFRRKAALFGHNAPKFDTAVFGGASWEGRVIAGESRPERSVDLDTTYDEVVPGGWLALRSPAGGVQVYQVLAVEELSRADYALSAKVTRVHLDHDDGFGVFTLRDTTAYVQSERLDLADLPIGDPVGGDQLLLDGAHLGLAAGRPLAVTGELADLPGVTAAEVREVAEVTLLDGRTLLTFTRGLDAAYARGTVTVNANVAAATHGQTTTEVLGSGDATVSFQSFRLGVPPLTHVGAPTATGTRSTLELVVGGVTWREVDAFHGRGPDERVYVTRLDEHGDTWVTFGDGRTGARLPTGDENVLATYRSGLGSGGLVAPGTLTLLQGLPAGVRAATNPLAGAGAADAESPEEIRASAPLQVMTLGRIVSLRDYEDFARAFAGIAKASATWTQTPGGKGVLVAVAGPGGAEIAEGGALHQHLTAAMLAAGDARVPLRVVSYRPAFFLAAAAVTVQPGWLPEVVLAAVEDELRAAFSFAARSFGQPVTGGEVVAAAHRAAGVHAVTLTALHRVGAPVTVEETLLAAAPSPGAAAGQPPPELLLIDPRPVTLRAV